jgi:peroxiredoxin
MVTVCTDTPKQIRMGHGMHKLQAPILSDPKLEVIDKLGLRNMGTNVRPPDRPSLPIPTTLLINESGKVVWMDQTEAYPQRSDPVIIRAALEENLALS